MTELEDLRGKSISWLLSRRKPLLCAVSHGAHTLGSLTQEDSASPVQASLASVLWRLERRDRTDVLAFAGSEVEVARATKALKLYEAWIDGVDRYQLECVPRSERATWFDPHHRQSMIFRRHLYSRGCESGEVVVSKTSRPEHAPVLLILGLTRLLENPHLLLDRIT